MQDMRRWILLMTLAVTSAVARLAQNTALSAEVTGAVKQPLTLTADSLVKLPRSTAKLTGHAIETIYEGVWLTEILRLAEAMSGVVITHPKLRPESARLPVELVAEYDDVLELRGQRFADQGGPGWLGKRR